MKKDAYYFPHFSNARNDSKLIKLRRVLGIEGYGLYFMLLEVLREQTDFKFPINGIEDLAYEWHISKEKIASVVKDFDLFEIIEFTFFSPKLVLYLKPYIEKSDRARAAANKRWKEIKDANAYANALPMQCTSNASKVKKSKVKESKEIYNDEIKNFTNTLIKYFSNSIITRLTDSQKITWIDTIDKLVRIDNYTHEEIELAVKNATNDKFWKNNFYSLTKLRKKNEKAECTHITIFLGLNPLKVSTEQQYKDHYKQNENNKISSNYAFLLKTKKDILYKFNDIISIDEFSNLSINGNIETILISFQNYGKTKDEFLTNLGIHVRKY